VDLGRRWHSASFRWLSVYASIFAISVMSLVGYIGWSATGVVERDTDIVMHWQLYYFDSIDDALLPDTIRARLEGEPMHTNYFGLFSGSGRYLAGDIRALPRDLPVDSHGHTLDRTLELTANQPSPVVVRAMAMRRANGQQLVIARDLTHVLKIRETTVNGLIGGGILCLVLTLVTGFLLSLGQMRRVADIRRATLQIANGDLNQRLPTGGRDELDMLTHLVNHMLSEVERLMHEVRSACDGIAHDLRTPLAHIRTLLAHISERGNGLLDDETRQLIESARGETNSLLDRFRAMLRISEIGALKRRGGFAAFDLQALLFELCELYEPLAEDRSLQWRVSAESIDEIHGDRALLFETFSNLLSNAIKFTPEGGEVRIAWTRTGAGPRVVISDSGPGIPASERAIVLQRFYRGDQARHLAGSGLGLSIVSAVLRVHDFALRIDSAEPGATMTIECWPHTLE
jgi:signal transduction histidine kinase